MRFNYADFIRRDFPDLATGTLQVDGITRSADVAAAVARFNGIAAGRLAAGNEGALPEIQAWRRTFSKMGLKPTQYRCASEALLRRFRQEGSLPSIHPLVDLCNAVSVAFAIPIAVFDRAKMAGDLQVRRATGEEVYETFSGEVEHPEADEVIFADAEARAHARRWTNRQSGQSAVRDHTEAVLIVAEALHESAGDDVARLIAALEEAVREAWPAATIAPSSQGRQPP